MMTTPEQFQTVGQLRKAAADIADAVLDEHWPENTFPVDPVIVSRRVGVEVYSAQLGNDVFGMLVGNANGARIYVDSDQPAKRYRFTCAHELGHYVDRSSRLDNDWSFIDRRSDEGRGTPSEVWANEFAGNLLMPARALRSLVDSGADELRMADEFGVSLSALRYRRSVTGI